MELHETLTGKIFFEHTLPQLNKNLESLTKAINNINQTSNTDNWLKTFCNQEAIYNLNEMNITDPKIIKTVTSLLYVKSEEWIDEEKIQNLIKNYLSEEEDG